MAVATTARFMSSVAHVTFQRGAAPAVMARPPVDGRARSWLPRALHFVDFETRSTAFPGARYTAAPMANASPASVSVLRRSRRRGVDVRAVRADAELVLVALGEAGAELAVSLVGDAEMHALNREYRGKNRPTDVLAFAMREGEPVPGTANVLGDVVISLDTAAQQAAERAVPLGDEVRALLVHGILHLLGYDHERGPNDARRMKAKERWLLRRLAQRD